MASMLPDTSPPSCPNVPGMVTQEISEAQHGQGLSPHNVWPPKKATRSVKRTKKESSFLWGEMEKAQPMLCRLVGGREAEQSQSPVLIIGTAASLPSHAVAPDSSRGNETTAGSESLCAALPPRSSRGAW